MSFRLNSWYADVLGAGVIVLLGWFVYQSSLSGPFIFDDHPNILLNPAVLVSDLSAESLWLAVNSGISSVLGRPVSMLSFGLDHYLAGGLDARQFRITNLLIHLVNGVLVFFFMQALARAWRRRESKVSVSAHWQFWLPFLIALAWVLHPINAMPVVYVVQRMASLSALFGFIAVLLYALGRLRHLAPPAGASAGGGALGWLFIGMAVIVFLPLSVLSKESGALFLLFCFLIELFFFRFEAVSVKTRWVLPVGFGLLLFVPALVAGLSLLIEPSAWLSGYETRHFTLSERLLTQASVVWFYLYLILILDYGQMGLFHDDFVLSTGLFEPWWTLFAIAGIIGLVGLAAYTARTRWWLIGFGIAWFLGAHLIESTVLPLELVFEHRNYVASLGPLMIMFGGAALVSTTPRYLRLIVVMLLAILLLIGLNTYKRAESWRSLEAIAINLAGNHPNSMRSNYEAGRMYAEFYRHLEAPPELFVDQSIKYLKRGYELDDSSVLPLSGLILAAWYGERPVDPDWLADMEFRLGHRRTSVVMPQVLDGLARCQRRSPDSCPVTQQWLDRYFLAAMGNDLVQGSIRANLYNVMAQHAAANLPKFAPQALRYSAMAVEQNPAEPRLRLNRINILTALGFIDEAREQLKRGRQIDKTGGFEKKYRELEVLVDAREERIHALKLIATDGPKPRATDQHDDGQDKAREEEQSDDEQRAE